MVTLTLVWVLQIALISARYVLIDHYSLGLLLAIAILSYLFGYLCGQMQFPDSPSADEEPPK
jgi:hypothetical protein